MKKAIFTLDAIFTLVSFNSCITMTSANVSNVSANNGNLVRASADGFGILHLSVPRDLAERVAGDLARQGATGNVSTVMTMREWGIVQYYKVIGAGTTGK